MGEGDGDREGGGEGEGEGEGEREGEGKGESEICVCTRMQVCVHAMCVYAYLGCTGASLDGVVSCTPSRFARECVIEGAFVACAAASASATRAKSSGEL